MTCRATNRRINLVAVNEDYRIKKLKRRYAIATYAVEETLRDMDTALLGHCLRQA